MFIRGVLHAIPAFDFPAEAGTHLQTPEGWKAELALLPLPLGSSFGQMPFPIPNNGSYQVSVGKPRSS